MERIILPYRPTRIWKEEIHPNLEGHRFSVVVAHRRFGKTVGAVNHLIKMAVKNDKIMPRYAYIAPFRNQAKQIAWTYLKHYTHNIPHMLKNESELFIEFPSKFKNAQGARIYVVGADYPDFNPYIKYLLKTDEVMEYLINLGIAGLKRVLTNGAFSTSAKVKKAMDEYEKNNNPIIGFFKECEDEEFQIENEPTNIVYKRYREYCLANSLQPMSNIEFSKQVNRILNMRVENKKINGKKYRIFIKNE